MNMSLDNDILVELNKEQIRELKETYRTVDEACYVYTLLDVAERWFGRGGLTVTSPGDAWKEDGSFVIFVDYQFPAIFPYSLDKTYKNIGEALLKTTRIPPSEPFYLLNILESVMDPILDTVKRMKRRVEKNYEHFYNNISIEKAKSFDVKIPDGTYIKELDPQHADQMNRVWPHRFENSELKVRDWLSKNDGFGLFLKENDELVSWVMQGYLGHINLLQTEEKYMGRGYGKVMALKMAKHLAENGHVPVACIMIDNVTSQGLFTKLGFEKKCDSYFYLISKCYE